MIDEIAFCDNLIYHRRLLFVSAAAYVTLQWVLYIFVMRSLALRIKKHKNYLVKI